MASARILVVDDEPDIADLVSGILQGADYEVVAVHGGQAALEELAAHPYDLVISDRMMPGVDGVAVYRAVQARPAPRPAVLFLSGYGDAGPREAAFQAAEVPTLPKPFDFDVLLETVRRLTTSGAKEQALP